MCICTKQVFVRSLHQEGTHGSDGWGFENSSLTRPIESMCEKNPPPNSSQLGGTSWRFLERLSLFDIPCYLLSPENGVAGTVPFRLDGHVTGHVKICRDVPRNEVESAGGHVLSYVPV